MPEEMLEERDCLLQEAIEHEAICPRMTAYYLNAALAVEEREVGELAGFERAGAVLFEEQLGVVDRVKAQRLLAGEGFLGMELAVIPLRPTRDSGGHAEKRIVGVHAAERTDFLHMVGAATHDATRREDALEWLEIAQPVVAELLRERARVEVEPRGLDVHDDAEARRGIGFVFQEPTLMPWTTVFGNVHLPLKLLGIDRLAQALAARLARTVVSTDAEVVKRAGQPIPDIVARHGWDHFRDIETSVCLELAARDGLIIDTGGGAILRPQNVTALKQTGPLFWLTASVETSRIESAETPNDRR